MESVGKAFVPRKKLVDLEDYNLVVLVKRENGCKNVQGYFAKAKSEEWSLNSVNTIFIFEHCRGKGFGKKLIALSYLLQKESGKEASIEGPLLKSGGKAAFHSFWRSEVLDFLL